MDARRPPRAVIDPKVRHVGFFAPQGEPQPPSRTQSCPAEPESPPLADSPAGNSLSPVMIPPPRHLSDNLASLTPAVPVPDASLRRRASDSVAVGSYNPSESLLSSSPAAASSPPSRFGDGEFSEDSPSVGWYRRSNSGKLASSLPGVGMSSGNVKSASLSSEVNNLIPAAEKSGTAVREVKNETASSSKPIKAKTTRAERRALQEAQRAEKAAAKAEGNKSAVALGGAVSEKKVVDHPPEKERKKDVPPPRMQFDDKNRVEKAKKRAMLSQIEAKNRVELFRHLPQYEHGTLLPNLESKFFELHMDPAVYKVGLHYLTGDISGGNARCVVMLKAFQQVIKAYSTPAEKVLDRDLTAKISSYVSFLTECRPLSISMGIAIRYLKNSIAKFATLSVSESDAKAALCSDIDRFIDEKIVLADKVIIRHAATKIRDGDVLLTYGSSRVVEMVLSYAHELGRQFRVVLVDSRPKLEGQALLRRLVAKGLNCTYTHINAISYIMHGVTRVFLGAASVLSNGTVYSRVGTACVAMVANAFHVPVLVCCEAYKFLERVQLDSICSNELGDPAEVAKVPGRMNVNHLDNTSKKENLQHLNLMYDATPSDYISMIITDYGMIPATSVPVIVREYGIELWI